MKITVLLENTKKENRPLIAEHGLSLYVEYNDKAYLVDAGSTDASLRNAKTLGINLNKVEFAMLSHGHYDHSGGFGELLAKNPQMKLYASGKIAEDYCSDSNEEEMHYIGIQEDLVQQMDAHLIAVDEVTQLAEGIWAVPHNTEGLGKIGAAKQLYHRVHGEIFPDDFAHETSYVFALPQGLVIFNSCSHGGAANIIREVQEVFPGKQLYAYVGGLHMKGIQAGQEICTFSGKELQTLADQIKKSGMQKIYTGHCTGTVGLMMMRQVLGEMIHPLHTGLEITL